MKEILVSYEEFKLDFPDITERFLKDLESYANEKLDEEELYFFYTWGTYPVIEDEEDQIIEDTKYKMKYDDRLDYELSRVIVEVYIKYDKYIRGEIVDDFIPPLIEEDFAFLLCPIMRYEQNHYNIKEVIDSIPNDIENNELYSLMSPKLLEEVDKEEVDSMTLDDILDKISKFGMKSLSEYEKRILDKLSKN